MPTRLGIASKLICDFIVTHIRAGNLHLAR